MSTQAAELIVNYSSRFKKLIVNLLSKARNGQLIVSLPDGEILKFGSGEVVAEMRVLSEEFFDRCFFSGDIGFGEAYTEGLWDTEDLPAVIRFMINNLEYIPSASGSPVKGFLFNSLRVYNRILHLIRANSKTGSLKNIHFHYDLSNEFFSLFLDKGMTYSSALFTDPDMSLSDAQDEKYRRLWNTLELKATDHVLEIGCGWGANAIGMARQYGCKVTAITISDKQYSFAKKRLAESGLEDLVDIRKCDYRDIEGSFDKVISIEMLEAVGYQYYNNYFSVIERCLKPDGILALQVITCPDSRFNELRKGTDWIQKHIFPGTLLPSIAEINKAINATSDMHMVDLKDMGLHYAKTLRIWKEEFNKQKQEVIALGFNDPFIRKWNYYLSYCEAAFDTRNINVVQLTYTRPNVRWGKVKQAVGSRL